jgi:hypothetical protein
MKMAQFPVISGNASPVAMNPAAPEGTPPRRISVYKHICKPRTAPPCLGEALRREALIELHGLMVFLVRVRTPVHARFYKAKISVTNGRSGLPEVP